MNTQASAVAGPRAPSALDPEIAARLKRDAAGLVPAVAQQYDTGEGAAPHPDHRPVHLLVPQPPGVLGKRRDVRSRPAGESGRTRL
jgi:hypothetical protein